MTTPATALRSLTALLSILALTGGLQAQAQKVTVPRVGVEVKPPKGWIELPAGGDRGATLRLFAAPREIAGRTEGVTHTPVLRVMFFPKANADLKAVVDGLPRRTPYASLEDFAKRGLRTTKVKVDKSAQKAGAFQGDRIVATVGEGPDAHILIGQAIKLDDGECGVCFETFEAQKDKLKKEFEGTLDALASCDRTAAGPGQPAWLDDPKAWAAVEAGKRGETRKQWAEAMVAATTRTPELGWKIYKSKYWTVLSAADAAFTKKMILAAELTRGFLSEKMPDIAKEQLPAILRIFASGDHYRAFMSTQFDNREYVGSRRELICADQPASDQEPNPYAVGCRSVLWQLIDDIDPYALAAMPRWFDNGWFGLVYAAKFDGKKLEFPCGTTERGRIEYQLRRDTMPKIWDIVQERAVTSPTDGSTEPDWAYSPESSRVLRWLLLHDGTAAFGKPTIVSDYVRALGQGFADAPPNPVGDVDTTDLSADQVKMRNKAYYPWRDGLLEKINSHAVNFEVSLWQTANDKWLEFNKNFK